MVDNKLNSPLDAEVFAAVAEIGSFSNAADFLGLSKSAVSRRVSALEGKLSVRLLERTTRHLRLTEAGQHYLAHSLLALEHLREAEASARLHSKEIVGTLKVLAPMSFGKLHVAPHMSGFLTTNPGLSVDLHLDDRKVNPHDLGCDLALQVGDLPESGLICRTLAPLGSIVCAAHSYIEKVSPVTVPADLIDHNCILFSYSDNKEDWQFKSELGQETVAVSGNFQVNNSEALCEAALQGLGIARLPTFIAGPYLKSGKLARLLAMHDMPSKTLYAVHGARRLLPKKIRVFIDYFSALYGPGRPYWETLDQTDLNKHETQ
ncbi:LysR family transcriptional regulator [Labrenzia sp. DG1229]|uniref:LysR family transcriptional regulator n=1 Tax=Labrenzia sp. DG1229 TaxID=681847 RepID=UPI00068B750A|nr:LysR family transcriptional regulator [Labrenzia sp. DG1229]